MVLRRVPARALIVVSLACSALITPRLRAGSDDVVVPRTAFTVPSSYHAVTNRNTYVKPALPPAGSAGWHTTDPTFGSRLMRVTDGATRPGYPNRSYSTSSAAHQLTWNATSDRFYIRSLDGWFIPYDFNPVTMTASRIQPTSTGQGGRLISSQVEPQFSFVSRDIIFGSTRDQTDPNHDYPVVHQYNFATSAYTTLLNLRTVTPVDPDTYAGALSSSAAAPEKLSIMFGGPSQDSHFKVAVFELGNPEGTVVILNTRDSQITRNGLTSTIPSLGFLLHHAWIDLSGQYVLLYPVGQEPFSYLVWNLANDAITPVTTRPFGHDALGYGVQVNQDCCTTSAQDAAQWQFRTLSSPNATHDLIGPVLTPKQTFLADHTSWNNAQPDRRVPVLSALYRYYNNTYNTTPWRAWDDEIVAIQTDAPASATVWRFAHHRSNITNDLGNDGSYFWYLPRPVVSPDGRWALFTTNWEKTLGLATGSEPSGLYRTDVFVVALLAGTFTDEPLVSGVTPIKAIHVSELRARIDVLRAAYGLPPYAWTDPTLASGMVARLEHLTDLRTALEQAYIQAGVPPPAFSDSFVVRGVTPIRAAHIEELRQAVLALEGG